jgi:hypothetical protein
MQAILVPLVKSAVFLACSVATVTAQYTDKLSIGNEQVGGVRFLLECLGYLTGLPPEMHKHAQDHLIEIYAPKEATALEAMADQVKVVELFQSELAQYTADLIDFGKADEIIAAAQQDVQAI